MKIASQLLQVQEVARSASFEHGDSAEDCSMQRTSTAFKNRSGFRGVRRVSAFQLLVQMLASSCVVLHATIVSQACFTPMLAARSSMTQCYLVQNFSSGVRYTSSWLHACTVAFDPECLSPGHVLHSMQRRCGMPSTMDLTLLYGIRQASHKSACYPDG